MSAMAEPSRVETPAPAIRGQIVERLVAAIPLTGIYVVLCAV